jgi:hypothetical protein
VPSLDTRRVHHLSKPPHLSASDSTEHLRTLPSSPDSDSARTRSNNVITYLHRTPTRPEVINIHTPTHTMAADSFRAQMNSLGWSRREEPAISTAPQGFASRLASLNPFAEGGYVRLPTTNAAPLPAQTRQQEEEGYFACEFSTPGGGRGERELGQREGLRMR